MKEHIIQRDGRIGPYWEHYVFIAPLLFVIVKLFAIMGIIPISWVYGTLVISALVCIWTHQMDKKMNASMMDEVDQTVPISSKFWGIVFVLCIGLNIWADFYRG
jgi:hypothetical protein